VVLAGPSGIGKSSLPRLYAEALGQLDEHLLVPVQPDWLDAHAVLGAFNSLSQRFEPAANGLTDRLITAATDLAEGRGGIYVICLDEMNLSRVEHYFAWFLSIMEAPSRERRLRLFAAAQERAADPYARFRSIPLGTNLRIVGTVNIDETTHILSPKVLDRTPVLTFEPPDLSKGLGEGQSGSQSAALGGIRDVHHEQYTTWVTPMAVDKAQIEQLLALDKLITGYQGGLGYRVRNRLLAYLSSAQGLLSSDRSLDYAIAQMVLPRLRAAAPGFAHLLEELVAAWPGERFPRCGTLLNRMLEADGEYEFFQLL
jgi:hypothetical protein